METLISPEVGRSSCECLLDQEPLETRGVGPPPLTVKMSKWSPTSKMSRMLGLLPEYVEQGCYAGGKGGLPSDGHRPALTAALFPGRTKVPGHGA